LNPIEIIFRGKDQTKAATDSVKQGLEGVEGAAKRTSSALDTAMGVLAAEQVQRFGDAVSGFMKEAIAEASEADAIMAQLESVISSTGGAAGMSAGEISEMATALSRMTLYEDEAILSGQTILLQFGRIGKDVFPAATQAMLDLATRMGIDIPSAAKIVGKALEGEFSGLSRFGIVLDDATKKQIDNLLKVGKTAEAQQLILDELNKRFGGSSKAAAESAAGSLDKVQKAWDDFEQVIGESLLNNPVFQDLLNKVSDAINNMADTFKNLSPETQTALVGIASFFALLAKLAPALISLKVLFGGLGGGGTAAGGGGLLAGIGKAFAGLATTIGGLVSGALNALAIALGTSVLALAGLAAAIALLVIVWDKYGPQAIENLKTLVSQWLQILKAGWDRIIFEFKTWINNWIAAIKGLPANFRAVWEGVGKSFVDGIWAGIKNGWEWLKTMIQNNINSLLEWVKNLLGIASPSKLFAVEVGEPIALGIAQGFKTGMKAVGGVMVPALQPAPAFSGGISGGARNGPVTVNVTGGFYSPVTHAERARIRKEQRGAALDILGRVLK